MNRILSLVLMLCVAASLFAATGLTVKAGGAFDLFSLKTVEDKNKETSYIFKGNGLGFNIGLQYDFNDKVMAYADFTMVFPSDFEVTADKNSDYSARFSDWAKDAEEYVETYLGDGKSTHPLFLLDASAGAAYKFDFNPIKLAVGGGAYYNLLLGKITQKGMYYDTEIDYLDVLTFYTIGLSGLIDAKYMVSKDVGIYLTAIPQVGFYSYRSFRFYESGEEQDDLANILYGFNVSFTLPITIGASYSF